MSFAQAAAASGFRLDGDPIRGGTGIVYRAIHAASGQPVAIKLPAPGVDLDRLAREAQTLSRLDHPAVARLRGLTTIDGSAALVVDWVEGRSLAAMLRASPRLPPARALALFAQVADAVEAVHRVGVVHRDLSPANIMIGPDDRVTVIDFGLSRGHDSATVTAEGLLAGTPRYLAPEVIEGRPATPAADQYALAIVLHEMLTGHWPFPEGDVLASALHHQLHSSPTPLDEVDPGAPPALADALLRALAKDPDERFPSVADLADEIEGTSRAEPGARPERHQLGDADPERTSSGRRWLVVAGFGLVALVGGLLVLPGLRSDDDPLLGSPAGDPTTAVSATAPPTTGSSADSASASASASSPPETVVDDGTRRTVAARWASGLAEQLQCNLLTEADFEQPELPANYFLDEDRPLVQVVEARGTDGSGALEVGPDGYGLWGEIVAVTAGQEYLFSGDLRLEGEAFTAEMTVVWLDEGFDEITMSSPLDILTLGPGQLTLGTAAPANAHYAVPRLYKDASTGVLVADELVFAPADADCRDLLVGEAEQ